MSGERNLWIKKINSERPIHQEKMAGTAENPSGQYNSFYDIQIKVVILILSIPGRFRTNQYLNDFGFKLSRSLKIKFDSVIGPNIWFPTNVL